MKYMYAVLSTIVLMLSGCFHNNDVETFRIGTNSWPGYEPMHLAKIQNEYKENVDVLRYSSTTVVLDKFRNSEIEAAALTIDEVILLKSQGYNPHIVAILDISEGADVLLSKPSISSISELKDKSIGVENSALGSYMLARVLELANLKYEDIQLVPLRVNQHGSAFKDDVVDAVITFEPVRSELLKFGAKEIFTSKQISGEIVDVLVVRKEFAKSKYVKDILRVWSISREKIVTKDSEALGIVSKSLNQTENEFIDSLNGLVLPTIERSNTMIKGSSLENTINKIQSVMLKKGLINKPIDAKALLN